MRKWHCSFAYNITTLLHKNHHSFSSAILFCCILITDNNSTVNFTSCFDLLFKSPSIPAVGFLWPHVTREDKKWYTKAHNSGGNEGMRTWGFTLNIYLCSILYDQDKQEWQFWGSIVHQKFGGRGISDQQGQLTGNVPDALMPLVQQHNRGTRITWKESLASNSTRKSNNLRDSK